MSIHYAGAAEVGKGELALLLGLLEMEQEADPPEAKTTRFLALADRILEIQSRGVMNAAGNVGESEECR